MPKYTDPTTGKSFKSDTPLSEVELEEAFGAVSGKTTANVPVKEDPLVNRLAKAVDPVTKYALPIAGAIGGGIAALPANFIAPGIAEATGIGLGTLAGQQGANFIGQMAGRRGGLDPKELLMREVPEAGINAAAGPLVGKALSPLDKLGKWLYSNAISTPHTKKWTSLFPGQEGTARSAAVNKGYEQGIYPNEFGIKTTLAKERSLKNQVDAIVDEGTAAGHTVSRYDLLKNGLASSRNKARVADPEAANVVDKLARRVEAIGNPKEMTTRDLLDLKRQLYKEASYEGRALSTGTEKQFNEVSKKGLASEAMTKLEDMYPQLKYLNQEESAYINLKEALEKTLSKHEQKAYPGGRSVVLSLAHLPAAVMNETINHPMVKTALSQILKNTASKSGKLASPIVYGATANTGD